MVLVGEWSDFMFVWSAVKWNGARSGMWVDLCFIDGCGCVVLSCGVVWRGVGVVWRAGVVQGT